VQAIHARNSYSRQHQSQQTKIRALIDHHAEIAELHTYPMQVKKGKRKQQEEDNSIIPVKMVVLEVVQQRCSPQPTHPHQDHIVLSQTTAQELCTTEQIPRTS
jgi:hypothetical protein